MLGALGKRIAAVVAVAVAAFAGYRPVLGLSSLPFALNKTN